MSDAPLTPPNMSMVYSGQPLHLLLPLPVLMALSLLPALGGDGVCMLLSVTSR